MLLSLCLEVQIPVGMRAVAHEICVVQTCTRFLAEGKVSYRSRWKKCALGILG